MYGLAAHAGSDNGDRHTVDANLAEETDGSGYQVDLMLEALAAADGTTVPSILGFATGDGQGGEGTIERMQVNMTQEASVAHSAYGKPQQGIIQAGDRAPDALGLVSTITADPGPTVSRLVPNWPYHFQAEWLGEFVCSKSSRRRIIMLSFLQDLVPVVQSMPVILQETVLKELVKRVAVLPSCIGWARRESHVEGMLSRRERSRS